MAIDFKNRYANLIEDGIPRVQLKLEDDSDKPKGLVRKKY